MDPSRSRRAPRSHELVVLRGGMRTTGATCTAAPKRMRCKYAAAREHDRNCAAKYVRRERRTRSLSASSGDRAGTRRRRGRCTARGQTKNHSTRAAPTARALLDANTPPTPERIHASGFFFSNPTPGAIVMTKSGRVVKPPVASDATAATIQSAVPATAVRKRPRRSPGPTRKGAVVERLVRRLHSLAEAKYGKKFVTPYESAETGVRKNWEVLEARRGDVLVLREADAQQKVGSLILGRAWRRLRVTWPTA